MTISYSVNIKESHLKTLKVKKVSDDTESYNEDLLAVYRAQKLMSKPLA